jgi:HlyD family secretion protein
MSADLSKLTISRDQKSFSGNRRSRKKYWIGGIVLVVIVGGLMAVRGGGGVQQVDLAIVASAYPSQSITVLNATGRVSAQRKAAVSTKATGRLEWLGVQEGSRVKAGEVIARLESLDVNASREQTSAGVRAAKANLEQGMAEQKDAESNLKRSQDLFSKTFISGAQLDGAQARYDKAKAAVASLNAAIGVAEANLKSATVSVEQTLIRAPFDGIVLTKNANVGDIITPFSSASDTRGAVVSMADMETLEVEADVSENSISKIKVDQPVEIQLDAYPDLRLIGTVSRIVPTVDRSKATLLVKVSFKERDPRVLPDMSAKVAFLSRELTAAERKPLVAVRPETIVKRDNTDVVFSLIDKDMTVKSKPVTQGQKLGDLVEVKGVQPGDKIVVKPDERLKDGAKVAQIKK